MTFPGPGWFNDPRGSNQQRWWNGAEWTARLRRNKKQNVPSQWPWLVGMPPVPEHALKTERHAKIFGAAVVGVIIIAIAIYSAVHKDKPTSDESNNLADNGSVTQKVYDWFNSGPKDDLLAVQGDEDDISNSAGASDIDGLTNACQSLKTDVVTFEADPPAPDAEIREDLARAMDYYSTAATECLASDYTSSADDTNSGTRWVSNATERIKELS